MYSVFLEDWFRIFPREQILILKYEDYIQDLQGHIQMVFDHLGLGTIFVYSQMYLHPDVIVTLGGTCVLALPPLPPSPRRTPLTHPHPPAERNE